MNQAQLLATTNCWSWIWHLYWLVMHDSLHNSAFRCLCHLTINIFYHRCGATVENDMYTLHDCPSAMDIWSYFRPCYPNIFYI